MIVSIVALCRPKSQKADGLNAPTQLVAADRDGRRWFAIDLDPAYYDVAVWR